MMSKFIELHKKSNNKPVIINTDRIKYVYEYNDSAVIWFEDSVYVEVEETYADIWLLLAPVRVMKKTNEKIEMKTQDTDVKKLIEDLLNSAGQFNELRSLTTDSERGYISVN